GEGSKTAKLPLSKAEGSGYFLGLEGVGETLGRLDGVGVRCGGLRATGGGASKALAGGVKASGALGCAWVGVWRRTSVRVGAREMGMSTVKARRRRTSWVCSSLVPARIRR